MCQPGSLSSQSLDLAVIVGLIHYEGKHGRVLACMDALLNTLLPREEPYVWSNRSDRSRLDVIHLWR